MSIYAEEFLAIFFAFKEVGHIFWENPRPVTDNKSVIRFFQTKIFPPTPWNACDYVIQLHFTIAQIPGKNDAAADYSSRLEIPLKEKVISKFEKLSRQHQSNYTSKRRESLKRNKFFTRRTMTRSKNKLQRKKESGTTQRTSYQIFHSKNSPLIKVKLKNFQPSKNYQTPIPLPLNRTMISYCNNCVSKY